MDLTEGLTTGRWSPLGFNNRDLVATGSEQLGPGRHWEWTTGPWSPLGVNNRALVATVSEQPGSGRHWEWTTGFYLWEPRMRT
jgi:hypothetical protein